MCVWSTGTLTVEEIYKDRDQFAALVREVAAPDVGRMGIEILSFTIKDVYDDVQYLSSLGKAQTAAVKRDADVGVAQANRDAGIRVRYVLSSQTNLYISEIASTFYAGAFNLFPFLKHCVFPFWVKKHVLTD